MINKMEIVLDWTDLRKIDELKYSNERVFKGVYLWGFTINEGFIPYYVGVSFDIEYRLFEHVNFLIGGKYSIYHKSSLRQFYNYKKQNPTDIDGVGIIYIPYWPTNYDKFLENRKQLAPHLDYMVDNMTYSYAVLNSEEIGKRELFLIEKLCINKIGLNRLANTKSGNTDESYSLSHKGSQEIMKLFKG